MTGRNAALLALHLGAVNVKCTSRDADVIRQFIIISFKCIIIDRMSVAAAAFSQFTTGDAVTLHVLVHGNKSQIFTWLTISQPCKYIGNSQNLIEPKMV